MTIKDDASQSQKITAKQTITADQLNEFVKRISDRNKRLKKLESEYDQLQRGFQAFVQHTQSA
jgi:septal ring factor EnvC (AmiA/AmiB activator)